MKKRNISKKSVITWTILLLIILFIKFYSFNAISVENNYSTGAYVFISRFFRFLFGWIPFSIGDVVYFLAACWLLYKIIKNLKLAFQKKFSVEILWRKFTKLIFLACIIYIVFNLFWGINYNRKGIAYQLQLSTVEYDTSDLIHLQSLLLDKVNSTKKIIVLNNSSYPQQAELFSKARECYAETQKMFPFLKYKNISVKSSLYGMLGNYLGYTGYYNPFTGEAQVNTTVPLFLQPDIAVHEMGHQLGYAKEDEASFAGYLAARNSTDTVFQYSTYLSLYMYANRDVYSFDSIKSRESLNLLLPGIKSDLKEWRDFNLAHEGYLEPALRWLYSNYLKINQQPKGLNSYNQVIALLVAYYKKYGVI